jgi:DNA-binding CsgD family transcriptional regulator
LQDHKTQLLIEKIYAAALDPVEWTECVQLFATTFGNRAAGFYIFDREIGSMTSLIAAGMETEFQQSLLDHFAPLNPYPETLHSDIPTGIAITDAHVVARETARQSEFYNDWIRPQQLDVYQIGAKVAQDANRYAAIVAQPDPARFDELEAEYLKRMEMLIPHISNALKINRMMEGHTKTHQALADAFDRSNIAIFVLDQNKRVGLANKTADAMLSENDVVRTNPVRGLVAVETGGTSQFATALDACMPGNPLLSTGPVVLKSNLNGARHVAWVQAIAPHTNRLGNKTANLFGLMGPEPALVVLISRIERDAPLSTELVTAIFQLTPAEGKLATALANGMSLTDYALETDVSRNTARAQLASIFEKTGTNRQAELVSKIWHAVGIFIME